ncbi:MAG: hypothetical protein ACOC2H_09675 [Spirochaetota bacterium]
MFVRKSQISAIIRKERQKEFDRCMNDKEKALKKIIATLNQKNEKETSDIKKYYEEELKKKDEEIRSLRDEIARNHSVYQEIRQRELQLDSLSASFETVLKEMNIKIQESLQPFYRVRAKIESAKRTSDRKNNKIQSLFEAM